MQEKPQPKFPECHPDEPYEARKAYVLACAVLAYTHVFWAETISPDLDGLLRLISSLADADDGVLEIARVMVAEAAKDGA